MITNALKILTDELQQEPSARAFALENGDCGLVIRKDGTIEIFQQGIDIAALQNTHSSPTTENTQALLNGQTLMVLSLVANMPELQQTILGFAVNEGTVDIPTANTNAR
jgi:hypothetical protein